MKIARFTHDGRTRLGVVEGAEVLDVGSVDDRLPTDVAVLLEAGGTEHLSGLTPKAPRLALDEVRLEAPLVRPAGTVASAITPLRPRTSGRRSR